MEVVELGFGIAMGLTVGWLVFRVLMKPKVKYVKIKTDVVIPPAFQSVKNRNKHSTRGADVYWMVDVFRTDDDQVTTRYFFTPRELNVAKVRAEKNKDEKQPA